jgi:hypothetical protein
MPTILRANGLRLSFYSRETGEPPHVDIDRAGATAKVWPESIALASNAGFRARELPDVRWVVGTNRLPLLKAWHDVFDPHNKS